MADNFVANPGAGGNTFASDDIGGVQYPRSKVGFGVDGAYSDVSEAAPLPTKQSSQSIVCAGFSASGASVLDPVFVQTPIVGTGVSYSQATSALSIASGSTANAEFLARSVASFSGSLRLRHTIIASSRVANSNFMVVLADLIGEGLAVTVNSATSITVALPGHTFNATNVGQFVFVGGIQGIANAVPGRYAIASVVAGVSINITVSGWPASGSGTATLFGRNHVKNLWNGTTATTYNVDAQRNGWASGDTATGSITSASPGFLLQFETTGREVFWSDSLRISSVSPTFTTRASRYENIPEPDVPMYVFLWSYNGTTGPTAVTWTLGHLSVETFANNSVYIQGLRSQGAANPLPVSVPAGVVTVAGSTTFLSAGTNLVGDVGVQYRANATGASVPVSIISPATPAVGSIKASAGRLLGWYLQNSATGIRSVKIFNATAPTLGTTAATFEIDIPAGGIARFSMEGGIGFATAMTWSVTAAKGLTDNTATGLASGDVSGAIFYA